MKNTIHTRNRFLVTLLFGAFALAAIVIATPEAAASPCINKGRAIPGHINQRVTNRVIERNRTIAIAGLTQEVAPDSVGDVPTLNKIPALGNLFRSKRATAEESELLIFVTPRIVEDAE